MTFNFPILDSRVPVTNHCSANSVLRNWHPPFNQDLQNQVAIEHKCPNPQKVLPMIRLSGKHVKQDTNTANETVRISQVCI